MPAERIDGLVAVLDAIRSSNGTTQPQLIQQVALGRTVVAQRVAELEAAGLVVTEGLAPSTEAGLLDGSGCVRRPDSSLASTSAPPGWSSASRTSPATS